MGRKDTLAGGTGGPRGRARGRPEQERAGLQRAAPTLAQSPCLASHQEDVRHGLWKQDLHGRPEAVPAVQGAGEAPLQG